MRISICRKWRGFKSTSIQLTTLLHFLFLRWHRCTMQDTKQPSRALNAYWSADTPLYRSRTTEHRRYRRSWRDRWCLCNSRNSACSRIGSSVGSSNTTWPSRYGFSAHSCEKQWIFSSRSNWFSHQSVELNTIGYGPLGVCWAWSSWVKRSQTQRHVSGLVSSENTEIGARKLAMEEPVEFCVFRGNLTVRNLGFIRLWYLTVRHSVGRKRRKIILTEFRGCWANIWASLIISALLLSCFARSIILSAPFCWSQTAPDSCKLLNAVTATLLQVFCVPPALTFFWKSAHV